MPAAAGFQPDWPGQLQAQAVGLAAIALFTFLVASLAFGPLAGLAHIVRRRSVPAPLVEESEPAKETESKEPVEAEEPTAEPAASPHP